jgi:hypothetical protein
MLCKAHIKLIQAFDKRFDHDFVIIDRTARHFRPAASL